MHEYTVERAGDCHQGSMVSRIYDCDTVIAAITSKTITRRRLFGPQTWKAAIGYSNEVDPNYRISIDRLELYVSIPPQQPSDPRIDICNRILNHHQSIIDRVIDALP